MKSQQNPLLSDLVLKQIDNRPQCIMKCSTEGCPNSHAEPLPRIRARDGGDEKQVTMLARRFSQAGWDFKRSFKRPVCPTCKQKAQPCARKEKPMAAKPEINRDTKRAITLKLNEVYDPETGCYRGQWTDAKTAKELNVNVTAVRVMRVDLFGDGDGNEIQAKLLELVRDLEKKQIELREVFETEHNQIDKAISNLRDML